MRAKKLGIAVVVLLVTLCVAGTATATTKVKKIGRASCRERVYSSV